MILFAADNHYGMHCGRVLYDCIEPAYDIRFEEDDWSCFCEDDLRDRYELLILNLISGSCDVPMPQEEAEAPVREYLESGGSLLLVHGGSAAFWQWDWWRPVVGFRWVRGDDADGFEPSTHPTEPYKVEIAKSRHPLCRKLREVDMLADEIYTGLEQTCPTVTLMQTTIETGTFPMCYEAATPWGGRVLGYLPGHAPEVVRHEGNVANCRVLLDDLLQESSD